MGFDVCPDNIRSSVTSPRISFSHDLNQTDRTVPMEHHHRRSDDSLLDSNFDFWINKSFPQEISSADELFSNGKILPTQIKKKETHQSQPTNENVRDDKKKRLKELLSNSFDTEEEDKKPLSKSFWQFRRTSSLNCENGKRRSLVRSLQFLSRSKSTGSATNVTKENQKHLSEKKPPTMIRKFCRSYSYGNGNGVQISPVLNIPPVYIAKGTLSLFRLGSFFCNGKVKKKKK